MSLSPEGTDHVDTDAKARTGLLFGAASLGVSIALLLSTALWLGLYGAAQRSVPQTPAVVRVGSAGEVESALRTAGVRGAVAIIASEKLGYSPVSISTSAAVLAWPVERQGLSEYYRGRTSRSSWVWVLARTGVARSVIHLVPSPSLDRLVTQGRELGYPGIADDGRSILANDEGYLRSIVDRLSTTPEKAILIVDASYFESGSAETLARELRSSGLPAGLIIAYDAQDDPTLSDKARTEYERMLPQLAAHLQGQDS